MSCKDLKQKRNLTVLYSVHVDWRIVNGGTDRATVGTVGLTDVFLMDGALGYAGNTCFRINSLFM